MLWAMAAALAWVPWGYAPSQASPFANVLAAWLLLVAVGLVAFCLILATESFRSRGRS